MDTQIGAAIVTALKENYGSRLCCGWRWMVWDAVNMEWVVYERVSYAKKTKVSIATESESDAVAVLVAE
jgi:hypothetical protein